MSDYSFSPKQLQNTGEKKSKNGFNLVWKCELRNHKWSYKVNLLYREVRKTLLVNSVRLLPISVKFVFFKGNRNSLFCLKNTLLIIIELLLLSIPFIFELWPLLFYFYLFFCFNQIFKFSAGVCFYFEGLWLYKALKKIMQLFRSKGIQLKLNYLFLYSLNMCYTL